MRYRNWIAALHPSCRSSDRSLIRSQVVSVCAALPNMYRAGHLHPGTGQDRPLETAGQQHQSSVPRHHCRLLECTRNVGPTHSQGVHNDKC